jgi:hypothetical protein
MKLSTFKQYVSEMSSINFVQSNGTIVPPHFHITEVGLITRHFIDCGGDVHTHSVANLQIWVADDVDHRLEPMGLLHIIALSKKILGEEDLEMEVEYQNETIGKYRLDFQGNSFLLVPTQTDCLAKIKCNIPQEKQKLQMEDLGKVQQVCCTPGGSCC